jgi:hypothetical protein
MRINLATIIFTFAFNLFFYSSLQAQDLKLDTAALKKELEAMDTDDIIAELRAIMDSMGKPGSFVSVNAGMSNSLFSARNNAFNANQSNTAATAFIPSVSYFHKSGFGIGATGYIRSFGNSPVLYQTAITPSFDHFGKKILFGVSYSYYLRSTDPSVTATPYSQEVYGYVQLRKTWLRPAIAAGWGGGSYKDVSVIPVKISGDRIFIVDTAMVTLNDYSLIGSVSHNFNVKDLFSKDDIFTLSPQLSLIGGMQQYQSKTISRRFFGERFKESELERIKKRYKTSSSSTTISLESVAFSMNLSWFKGAFSINSGYFLGYYFNVASSRRYSHIFNTGIGYTF